MTTVASFLMEHTSPLFTENSSLTTAFADYYNYNRSDIQQQNFTVNLHSNNTIIALEILNITTRNTTSRPDGHRPNNFFAPYYPYIILFTILSILSIIALLAIYTYLREYKNLPGKVLITMALCLMTTYIFLCIDMGARRLISREACYAVGIVIHVNFLALFFWTNVLTYDVWKNLTNMKTKVGISANRSYFKYSMYAWSITIVTALPAIVFDQVSLIPDNFKPRFGIKRCWLSGTQAFLVYFNLPVGMILLCNAVMFILTAVALRRIRRDTSILENKKNTQRLGLYLKLFFLMGFTWITQYIPWITGVYVIYAFAGLLTCLHGVFLFAIFICKRQIYNQIQKKRKKQIYPFTPSENRTKSTVI